MGCKIAAAVPVPSTGPPENQPATSENSLDGLETMNAADVRRFIEARTVLALDPTSNDVVATVQYRADGTCTARFPDGDTDTGQCGFVEDRYWTRYTRFRDGARNEFFLVSHGVGRAQAYYADGRQAFLQVHEEQVPDHTPA